MAEVLSSIKVDEYIKRTLFDLSCELERMLNNNVQDDVFKVYLKMLAKEKGYYLKVESSSLSNIKNTNITELSKVVDRINNIRVWQESFLDEYLESSINEAKISFISFACQKIDHLIIKDKSKLDSSLLLLNSFMMQ